MTQKEQVLTMLRQGPKTTHDFCGTHLSAEYRKWLSIIRKDVRKRGGKLTATRLNKSCWKYELFDPALAEPNGQLQLALA